MMHGWPDLLVVFLCAVIAYVWGRQSGYAEGDTLGKLAGWVDGKAEGYRNGAADGYARGCEATRDMHKQELLRRGRKAAETRKRNTQWRKDDALDARGGPSDA